MSLSPVKVSIDSLGKRLYPHCSVLVDSRNWFSCGFLGRIVSVI